MNNYFKKIKKELQSEIFSRLEKGKIKDLFPLMNDYFYRGGKLLRPTLCSLSCQLFGGEVKKALPTACALEFFHNFALIHDDIEDRSQLRRGKKCLYKLYGIPLSINAGDGLLIKTYDILLENEDLLGEKKCLEILKHFTQGVFKTIQGQALDIGWAEKNNYQVNVKDYLKMAGYKTGIYTGSLPLGLGAIIAGASQNNLDLIESFGYRMAIAFQIRDDLLNLIGSEKKYGKEIGGDLNEGKKTLMIIHYFENSSSQEKEWMKRILENQNNSSLKIKETIQRLEKKGSLDFAQKKSEKLIKEALSYLKGLPNNEAKKSLVDLSNFIIKRKK